MHPEAFQWVADHASMAKPCMSAEQLLVLDIGGRNINGTVRDLFPGAVYTALDILPGDGVDIVADAAHWDPDGRRWDLVVCTEVFEHAREWPLICKTAFKSLFPGGVFIATMAGPGRNTHSGVDGGPVLHDGEHYGNVSPDELFDALCAAGFANVVVDQQPYPQDVRCTAVRPKKWH